MNNSNKQKDASSTVLITSEPTFEKCIKALDNKRGTCYYNEAHGKGSITKFPGSVCIQKPKSEETPNQFFYECLQLSKFMNEELVICKTENLSVEVKKK